MIESQNYFELECISNICNLLPMEHFPCIESEIRNKIALEMQIRTLLSTSTLLMFVPIEFSNKSRNAFVLL